MYFGTPRFKFVFATALLVSSCGVIYITNHVSKCHICHCSTDTAPSNPAEATLKEPTTGKVDPFPSFKQFLNGELSESAFNSTTASAKYKEFNKATNESRSAIALIIVVTPTYYRPAQRADLTRLAQTLMLVPNIHWIVVEDAKEKSAKLEAFLKTFSVNFSLLNVHSHKSKKKGKRGVDQRNLGLDFVVKNVGSDPPTPMPLIYFADDDNSYHARLFDEVREIQVRASTLAAELTSTLATPNFCDLRPTFYMGIAHARLSVGMLEVHELIFSMVQRSIRKIKTIGAWPVGLAGGQMVERPIVKEGKVTGFIAWHAEKRKFPLDMAGFAFSYKLLAQTNARFSYEPKSGDMETYFLTKLGIERQDLEPLADNCTKVMDVLPEVAPPEYVCIAARDYEQAKVQKLHLPISDWSYDPVSQTSIILCLCRIE